MTETTSLRSDGTGSLDSGPGSDESNGTDLRHEAPPTAKTESGLLFVIRPGGREDRSAFGALNEAILRRLGGTHRFPPPAEAAWPNLADLDDLVIETKELVQGDDLLCGDPRLAATLPLFREALDTPLSVIFVLDYPARAARRIADDLGISLVHGIAIYERLCRSAASTLRGLRVFVVPPAPEAGLVALLDGFEPGATRVLEELDRPDELGPPDEEHDAPVLGSLEKLLQSLQSMAGPSEDFSAGELGEESDWVRELLRAESDLDRVVASLEWTIRRIEPLLAATPPERHRLERLPVDLEGEATEDLDPSEPEEGKPYPLSASEDRRAYHRWLRARRLPVVVGGLDDPPRRRAATRPRLRRTRPIVSILVPVWRTPRWALERCVSSVLAQTSRDWELCICDDGSDDRELAAQLRGLHRLDRRIKVTALAHNAGISAATNAALEIATGRFIAFLDHDDELAPNALAAVESTLQSVPDADVLYSDEDKVDSTGERFDPLFKPDWSPDLLLSFAYTCHLTVVRRKLLVELGGLRSEFDGSQDYDLSLRATERARRIVHIPEVLYHWRSLPGSAASDAPGTIAKPWAYEAGRRAIEDALQRRGEPGEVEEVHGFPGRYHVRRAITSRPLVSIIVPFRDEPALLATCATSLRADPGYDRIELVLVDNGSELPETHALLERLSEEQGVRIVRAPGPFNWAAINNAAVKEASGSVLVFANNDIEARAPRWLDALLGHALRPEVGAVGARLVYPDGAIQHAGVVIGLGGIAGHVLRGLPGWHPGYNSMAIQTRNCSVVTGACMMTRREVFDSVSGFDELLPVAFNDVDYCLKLRDKGYLIVYTPLAELIHHESRSRGHTDDLVESRRIVNRWAGALRAGDPYMHPSLSHWRYWCPLSTAQEDDRWKTYLETSVLTARSSSST